MEEKSMKIAFNSMDGIEKVFNADAIILYKEKNNKNTDPALSLSFVSNSVKAKRTFYCQREIEFESKCKEQCDHCRAYYAPLERQ